MKHIGIAACSAEGAALCYRTVISEGLEQLGQHRHPEVSMHTPSLSNYMDHLEDGREDWVAAGRVVVDSVDKLRKAGAEFAICPDNTIHEGIDRVREEFSLPFLHIAEVVASHAQSLGLSRLLILGTRYTANSTYYDRALRAAGIEQQMPTQEEVKEIDRVIWEELYWGELKQGSRAYYQSVIESYKQTGCDGVVLGCTEIPLLISQGDSALPILDSTRLLARAALRKAMT